jgi:hypothetical protein
MFTFLAKIEKEGLFCQFVRIMTEDFALEPFCIPRKKRLPAAKEFSVYKCNRAVFCD